MKKYQITYKDSIGTTYIDTVPFKFQADKILREIYDRGYKLISFERV